MSIAYSPQIRYPKNMCNGKGNRNQWINLQNCASIILPKVF